MHDCQHQTIHQKDYTVPDYLVETVELSFDLDPEQTQVESRLAIRCNHDRGSAPRPLVLDGEELTLVSLKLDGAELTAGRYQAEDGRLVIHDPPESFLLEVTTRINPKGNTALSGLYASGPMLCTQCEAEGFRRITYFTDRPDVMAVYTVTLKADRESCPVLLANGNLVEKGELPGGRHFATWHDPFKKPSYLFAVVAGDLVHISDRYTTMSGKEVQLEIYVEEKNREKCDHALPNEAMKALLSLSIVHCQLSIVSDSHIPATRKMKLVAQAATIGGRRPTWPTEMMTELAMT